MCYHPNHLEPQSFASTEQRHRVPLWRGGRHHRSPEVASMSRGPEGALGSMVGSEGGGNRFGEACLYATPKLLFSAINGKAIPNTPWGCMREWTYSSTTSALDGGERQLHPRRYSQRYPLDRRLGGLQSRCGRCGEEKNLLPRPGIKPRSSSL
jgi:hypothetical protein